MLRRAVALLVTAVVAAAVVVGLPVGPAPTAPAAAADPKTYVALGDSFAAGPLIPVQEPTGCLRSTNNYAKHLALRLGYSLTDVTCSGAETEDMEKSQGISPDKEFGRPVPRQFNALKPSVDLVTLQIGGNDIGFSDILKKCLEAAQNRVDGNGATTCKGNFFEGGVDTLRKAIADAAPFVGAAIRGAKKLVDPEGDPEPSTVLVLGYSGIFSIGPTAECTNMIVGAEDAEYLRGIQEALNAMIADQARLNGGRYVDVYSPSAGHTACDAPVIRWVEPLVPVNAAAPVHPNLTGMLAIADILEEVVTREQSIIAALECMPATSKTNPALPWVLLVHGTGVTASENWGWGYQPDLANRGHRVCTVDLPDRALNDIQVSAEYVVHAIRKMHEDSGNKKISVIGHSQGGLVPRWALRWWPDLRDKVDDLITLGTPHNGTTIAQQTVSGYTCEACHQMQDTSAFISALNSWDDTPGDVSYTSIWTQYDELVQPATNADLSDNAHPNVESMSVQSMGGLCAWRTVDHMGLAGDAVAHALALDALLKVGPASLSRTRNRPPGTPDPCAAATFSGASTGWYSGGFQDQWQNEQGGVSTGARYTTAEPPLAHYVRAARLNLEAPTTATATDSITVTAALTDAGGQPLGGRTVTFSLGTSSASATTSSAGNATATLVVDADAGPAAVTAVFAGDDGYTTATASATITVQRMPVTMTVTAPSSVQAGDALPVAAVLTDRRGVALADRAITFTLGGSTISAVTDSAGRVHTDVPADADAGPATLTATVPATPRHEGTARAVALTVLHEDATVVYTGETAARGDSVTVSARLTETDSGTALAGRTISFTVGSVTATAVTGADGSATATVVVADHGRSQQVTATFAGDRRYRGATTESTITWGRS